MTFDLRACRSAALCFSIALAGCGLDPDPTVLDPASSDQSSDVSVTPASIVCTGPQPYSTTWSSGVRSTVVVHAVCPVTVTNLRVFGSLSITGGGSDSADVTCHNTSTCDMRSLRAAAAQNAVWSDRYTIQAN
jgi:hypothetical protein